MNIQAMLAATAVISWFLVILWSIGAAHLGQEGKASDIKADNLFLFLIIGIVSTIAWAGTL